MQVQVYKDYLSLSAAVAAEIILLLQKKPDALLCMASGDTPKLACQELVEKARKEQTDLRRCTFVGLDEWVGIPPTDEGSCHHFFQHKIIQPLNFKLPQYHLFDGQAIDLDKECKTMNEVIDEKGGIDLLIVGIGMNGHIGFNEPGVSLTNRSHVADLAEITQTVGRKYFKSDHSLKQGITIGFADMNAARKVIVMANGVKKAAMIQQAVEGPISNQFPASVFQTHPGAVVMVDEEAGSQLKK